MPKCEHCNTKPGMVHYDCAIVALCNERKALANMQKVKVGDCVRLSIWRKDLGIVSKVLMQDDYVIGVRVIRRNGREYFISVTEADVIARA